MGGEGPVFGFRNVPRDCPAWLYLGPRKAANSGSAQSAGRPAILPSPVGGVEQFSWGRDRPGPL